MISAEPSEVFLISLETCERFGAFADYLENRGYRVQCAPAGESLDFGQPERPFGVVLWCGRAGPKCQTIQMLRSRTRYLGVIVVVAAEGMREEEVEACLCAGAHGVLTSTDDFERIQALLHDGCASSEVPEETRAALLAPFALATCQTLREMAGLEVRVRAEYQQGSTSVFGDISAIIGLTSGIEGSLVLSFPQTAAEALADRLLRNVSPRLARPPVDDCIGEVANVIAGQAKGILAGTPRAFTMSTPTIISGCGHEIRRLPAALCLVQFWESEGGDFALLLRAQAGF